MKLHRTIPASLFALALTTPLALLARADGNARGVPLFTISSALAQDAVALRTAEDAEVARLRGKQVEDL